MKLKRKFVEKPWGQEILPEVFPAASGKKIGEIWFDAPKGISLQLMVKYLFTSDKLSIQVHPNDRQPGALLGLGLKKPVSATKLKTAAILGEIEHLLDWKPVKKGDFFHVPAGTIHAIGAGVSLVEVQRNVDITYRLFDYGRGRELHLEDAIGVAKLAPYDMKYFSEVPTDRSASLFAGSAFGVFQIVGTDDEQISGLASKEWQVIPLEGSVTVRDKLIKAGECGVCARLADIDLSKNGRSLFACTMP